MGYLKKYIYMKNSKNKFFYNFCEYFSKSVRSGYVKILSKIFNIFLFSNFKVGIYSFLFPMFFFIFFPKVSKSLEFLNNFPYTFFSRVFFPIFLRHKPFSRIFKDFPNVFLMCVFLIYIFFQSIF